MTQANQPAAPAGPGLADWLLATVRRYRAWLPFPLPEIVGGAVILTVLTAVIMIVAD